MVGFFLKQVYTKVERADARAPEAEKTALEGRLAIKDAVTELHSAIETSLKETRAALYDKLDRIREGVQIINGRVGRLETWTGQHEKVDDSHHGEATRRLDDQHQRIGQLERLRWNQG